MSEKRSYRFCPVCGGGLLPKPDMDGHLRLTCTECSFLLYINPKPSGNALVVKDGKVLLVRRSIQPYKGWWDIPGGFLEGREHPEEGARREVREETGLEVELTGLLGIFVAGNPYGPPEDGTVNLYYLARPVGGALIAGSDAASTGWFAPDKLPKNIAFRSCREALEAWKASLAS